MAFGGAKEEYIFSKLKSSSSCVVYNGLLELRSNITKTKEGLKTLRENKVLKLLVDFLHKPNEKILDVTLSILGNCCLDSDCRNEVVSHGIVGPLSSVIYNIARDSIQCRACRLVGNLAKEPYIAEQLHIERIADSIVSLLVSGSGCSTATQQMAVRALRMLWSVANQREQMLNCQAVRTVALLLPVNQEVSGEQHLLLAIVKALVTFTNYRSEECAQQVQGNGSGFKHLVCLIANPRLKCLVLECICNLCYSSGSRPALGSAGTVEIILMELFNHQEDITGLHAGMVLALCHLCAESVNRAKIRRAGGLPLMLRIARNPSATSLRSFIFEALVQFLYDEASLKELLREGLVNILVNKVADFVKENGSVHSGNGEHMIPLEGRRKCSICNDNGHFAFDSNIMLSQALRNGCTLAETSDASANTDLEPGASKRKKFRADSPSYQAVIQEQGCSNRCRSDGHRRDPSPDYSAAGDWSPGSPSSMCISPGTSPPHCRIWTASPSHASVSDGLSPPSTPSPLSSEVYDGVDFPEVYSPICCDAGGDDRDDDDDDDDDDGGGDDDDVCDDDDDDKDEEAPYVLPQDTSKDKDSEHVARSPEYKRQEPIEDGVRVCDKEIDAALILLSRVSHMEDPVEELATQPTLSALIDYITLIRNPQQRASSTLYSIIRNHHYFKSFLLHRFVLTIHSRLCQPQHSSCCTCISFKLFGLSLISQISRFAHSGFGEGELAHHLLKGEKSVQRLVAVCIPYIVRMHAILWKLMVQCDALKRLLEVLDSSSTENDGLRKHVSTSLILLAVALNVPKPRHHTRRTHKRKDKYQNQLEETASGSTTICSDMKASEDAVLLQLDDGSSVQVSKKHLSLLSPVFEAMFRGNFKESHEDCVPLPGISHYSLINLLSMKSRYILSHMPGIDLSKSLDLIAVLDRFLVTGSEQVIEMIVREFLSHSTAVDIYVRCVEAGSVSHFHTLRYDTVRYMLTSNSEPNKNTEKLFEDFLRCPYKKELLRDITNIFEERLDHLRCKTHHDKFKKNAKITRKS